MPKALAAEMKRGYEGKGLSEEEVNHRVYGKLNKMGAMRGSKVTRKGRRLEKKYLRHRGRKFSSADAADALEGRF